jgi:hypothetical protein
MPMTREERLARKMQHTKQERIHVSEGAPSVSELKEGVSVIRSTSDGLVEYVRYKNTLYRKVLDRADLAKTKTATVKKQESTLPIFQASRSGANHSNLAADTEHTIAFNATSVDTMSGFSTSAYKYTISVSGIYFLYYNVTFSGIDSAMSALNVQMKDNDGNYFAIHRMDDKEYTADSGYLTRASHAIRRLDVGQTIEVIVYISGGHDTTDIVRNISSTTGAETIFGGYLLTPKTFNETTQTTAVAGGSDSGGGLGGGGIT